LAIHPELVNKLLHFQNSILGNSDGCPDENWDSDSNEDTTDIEDGDRQLDKQPDVAVELKVVDGNEHVKVNISKIPLVSYPPKASKSSLSGMPTIILHDAYRA
jgi:activating signal cointegrator complex subunit 1